MTMIPMLAKVFEMVSPELGSNYLLTDDKQFRFKINLDVLMLYLLCIQPILLLLN